MLVGHDALVWSAAFSPDGTRVITASDRQDRAALGRLCHGLSKWPSCAATTAGVYQRRLLAQTARASSPPRTDKTARLWDAGARQGSRRPALATAVGSRAPPSRRTDRASSPASDRTRQRGCGTPPRARKLAVLSGHDKLGSERRVLAGRRARPHRLSVTTPRGCGTRRPAKELAVLRGHERRGWERGLLAGRRAHRHRLTGQNRADLGCCVRRGTRHHKWPQR